MKLKSELMLLAAGSLVPLLAFAVVAVLIVIDHEQATREQEAMGRVTSAMSAIDAEVHGSIMTLQALAASKSLETGDLRAFHEEAKRVLATRPNWLNIGLASISREQLLDATRPFGEHAAFGGDDDTFERAVDSGKPAVGSVRSGPAVGEPTVRVRVPVLVDGAARYVLTAPIKPASFVDVLRAQRLPEDWVIALVDRNRKFVARIPEAPLGGDVSPRFREALDRAPNGWLRGTTDAGREVYTPYVTSGSSGWVLALAMPAEIVDAAARRTSLFAAGGALAALASALLLAWLMARRIAEPITSLARATAAMGRGAEIDVRAPGRSAEEVDQLRDALREASIAIRQREAMSIGEKAALERERQALAAADVAKDQFIAMLSHELRNPLAALTNATHLLKASHSTEPAVVLARDVAERQVRQIARLIEDLLDMSRIVTGKVNLEPEFIDLAVLVRQSVESWRAAGRFDQREVTLTAASATIYADRARMEQILSNLLDNALKFSSPGGHVDIAVEAGSAEAILRVADDGAGIDPAVLGHMFELFMQGGQGLARKQGGLGIGLALVRRLAELQGGRAEGHSEGPGKGATFVVHMPLAQSRATVPHPASHAPGGGATPRAWRIVLIEDNDDMRESLTAALALDGHQLHAAPDGRAGVALARAVAPDIVVADIGLPDIDGYAVARELRASLGAGVILIALTGYGQAEDRQRAYDAGFDEHLAKPVTPEALQRAIALAASRRKRDTVA